MDVLSNLWCFLCLNRFLILAAFNAKCVSIFQIMNTSTLSVKYSIQLDSNSLLRYDKAQDLPDFVNKNSAWRKFVGASKFFLPVQTTDLLFHSDTNEFHQF